MTKIKNHQQQNKQHVSANSQQISRCQFFSINQKKAMTLSSLTRICNCVASGRTMVFGRDHVAPARGGYLRVQLHGVEVPRCAGSFYTRGPPSCIVYWAQTKLKQNGCLSVLMNSSSKTNKIIIVN